MSTFIFSEYHRTRQTDTPDRHRQADRQTQNERQTDKQHTHKHVDKKLGGPGIEPGFRG